MSFTCPICGRTSYNPNDELHRYCGHCHVFLDDVAAFEDIDNVDARFDFPDVDILSRDRTGTFLDAAKAEQEELNALNSSILEIEENKEKE